MREMICRLWEPMGPSTLVSRLPGCDCASSRRYLRQSDVPLAMVGCQKQLLLPHPWEFSRGSRSRKARASGTRVFGPRCGAARLIELGGYFSRNRREGGGSRRVACWAPPPRSHSDLRSAPGFGTIEAANLSLRGARQVRKIGPRSLLVTRLCRKPLGGSYPSFSCRFVSA